MKKYLLSIFLVFLIYKVQSQSFKSHTLPIVSITMDSLDLWGPKGIYSNPEAGGIEWERPCSVSFYIDGSLATKVKCGIRIQGASSVGMPKKSFRLFFRSDYGMSNFEFPIFGAGKTHKFDKLVLKAGYDDDLTTETGTLLRDALSVELWNRTNGIPQLSRWFVLYLNNQYWGIYDLRESTDQHYIKAHTDFNNFDLIRFKNEGPDLIYGSILGWQDLYSFIKSADLSNDDNYAKIEESLDMDNFLNLMAFVQCSQYASWGWGSSMYKNHADGAKWKFSIWDTDRAYTDKSWDGFGELYNQITSYKWGNNFYHHISENAQFKKQLFAAINDLQNTVFYPETAVKLFDSLYTIIQPEVAMELERWNPDNTSFESNVEVIRTFLNQRSYYLNTQLSKKFSVDTNKVSVTLNVIGNGKIQLNTLKINQFPWSGEYFKNNDIRLLALPDSGNHFVSWDIAPDNASRKLDYIPSEPVIITATFEEGVSVPSLTEEKPDIEIFPNPFSDHLNIKMQLKENANVKVKITDPIGRTRLLMQEYLIKGDRNFSLSLNKNEFENYQLYLVSIEVNGINFVNKKIIRK